MLASREQPTNTGRKRISWEGENKGSGAWGGGVFKQRGTKQDGGGVGGAGEEAGAGLFMPNPVLPLVLKARAANWDSQPRALLPVA